MEKNKLKTRLTVHDSKVLILPDESETATKGGVIIPDTAQEAPRIGTVVAVGEGYLLASGEIKPLNFKEGDRIIYPLHQLHKIEFEDVEYVLANDARDIFCKINNEE